jgi:enolase-phosphatase E1
MRMDGKHSLKDSLALSLIKTAMIEKKMTQAELADAADIHEKTILTDLEGVAVPMRLMTETLVPYVRDRLGGFIAADGEDEEVEEALEEAGRLMGGFSLKPAEAEALLLRWMKQDRKVPPLKFIQGLIWKEGCESGAIKPEIYYDVADCLNAWKNAGVRLFVYSSASELAQNLFLGHSPAGDLTGLFEGFFDTETGQKIEPASYTTIREKLGLPAAAILVLADNEEELDAAREAGLATTRIAREGGTQTRHPVSPDLASLKLG